ncbi:MAG: enoyl-CoA hydratase/isomerase family protein [Dehalococcoidia bacterium]|nr:enoyl-CoA hydratase/isomerase family protein [Dehalococcoidia bacterium]MCB9491515.1 enoyl-CoA hydratase/isomerase family protein [Dehalococcoidia bacterium]
MSDVVRIEDRGHVRVIRLNRPEKKNALSTELAWAIVHAVEDAAHEENVWVIGITGTADAFCSGLDLTPEPRTESYTGLNPQDEYLDELGWVSRFPMVLRQECDKPIVAGINGVAVGAGLGLAMACDLKIMTRSARLIAGYPRIGGSPDGGLSWTLLQAMGYEQALRFLLENRTVMAEEAHALGMVGEVVDDDRFAARFDEYCDSLTKLSPITARLSKRVVRRAAQLPDMEGHMRYELLSIGRAFGSNDGKEARRAFLEGRAPEFKGS